MFAPLQASINTNLVLTQLLNGLVLGMSFIIISYGLSIVLGLMGIINFAHGDMMLIGAYVAWTVVTVSESVLLAYGAAILAVVVVSAVMERTLLRLTYERDPILQLLATFGVAEVLREGARIVWGTVPKNFPTPTWASGSTDLLLFSYPSYRLFVIFAAGLIVAIGYLILFYTDIGLIIRAGSEDREMVDMLGIDIRSIYFKTFLIGGAFAGIAGAFLAPIQNVHPQFGINFLIPAFVVVIIGGIGSIYGTIVAGIIIGELIALIGFIDPSLARIGMFLFMIGILLVRPYGLFGERGEF